MRTFLIGLGGSGIEVVTRLKKDLQNKLDAVEGRRREELEAKFGDVSCVVMDTDHREEEKCVNLGINPIILSGSGAVGNYLQALKTADDDVYDWCPNTLNEATFLSEQLDDGASQCRMKSRLCLGVFLKNELNDLTKVFDHVSAVSGDLNEDTLRFMVISSIAGGTGSGIFIQVALYIKRYFFRKFGVNVKIYGLFACPDLYKKRVPQAQWESIYANAYAAVRELNAINIIYGDAAKPEYGKNIKIRINSKAEGNLFSPADKGQFGKRPFDQLYFIDDVNAFGGVVSNLDEYYDIMANFVYTRMFSPISEALMSKESNEMDSHSVVPLAIYGSAGAAMMKYPYEDIVSYLAVRFLNDSVSNVWTVFDAKWHEFVKRKEMAERAKGYTNYRPTPKERSDHFITEYRTAVYNETAKPENKKFAFLRGMLKLNGSSQVPLRVETYMKALQREALQMICNDSVLVKLKSEKGITDEKIAQACKAMAKKLARDGDKAKNGNPFSAVTTIEAGIAAYISECCDKIEDMANVLSMEIICDNPDLWESFESHSCNIVKGLFCDENGEMPHPLAIRYLLYCFKNALEDNLTVKMKDGVSREMTLQAYSDDLNEIFRAQKLLLDPNKSDGTDEYTIDVLNANLKKKFGKVKATASLNRLKDATIDNINGIETTASNAILVLALRDVNDRLADLIANYELFFDKIDDYQISIRRDVTRLEADPNAPGKTTVYVGASPSRKKALYATVSAKLNPDSGEVGTAISHSFYNAVRDNLWKNNNNRADEIMGMEMFFRSIRDNLETYIESDSYIRPLIDKDVFTAMLDDYKAGYGTEDIDKFNPAGNNQSPFADYLKKKFSELIVRGAPMLNYDLTNPYALYYSKDPAQLDVIRVSHPYAFLELNPSIASAIKENLYTTASDETEAVKALIEECSNRRGARLPSFEANKVSYVPNEWRTNREIFLVSSVHCLQPYQIGKFDELKGGEYYTYYRNRIDAVVQSGILSRSPHLDKRWHLHGMMPYININKEMESRYSLVKAFVYAFLFTTIKCSVERGVIYYHFYDPEFSSAPEKLSFKGNLITNYDIAKILFWLMDREDIVKKYADYFDSYLELQELELAAKYNGDVREYEAIMTRNDLIHYMREDLIGAGYPKNQFTAKGKKFTAPAPLGILKVAAYVKNSEEASTDYNYAELIINVAEEVIFRFARAPFSEDQLRSNTASEHMTAFRKILEWNKLKFMESYCESELVRRKLNKKKDDEEEENGSGEDTDQKAKKNKKTPKRDADQRNEPEAEPDQKRLSRVSAVPNSDVKRMVVRDVPPVITDSNEYRWLDMEFQIDPNMNIPRPDFED